jgi:3(or 17)beta-hydroxysteroid dehydrogenase
LTRLAGKRCIVTGGASGIGLAIAAACVREGAQVLLTDIDGEKGEQAAKRCGALFARQDVSNEAQWAEIIDLAGRSFGGIDILVNNAGISGDIRVAQLERATAEDWRNLFRVNVDSVFFGCRAVIPAMRESGGGSIINLSSIAALAPTPFIAAYGAGKAAVHHFSRSVALNCADAGDRIRCNTIHPGQIITPMHTALIRETAKAEGVSESDVAADLLSRVPLGEFGAPEDVAFAAVYLASDESRHVTGAALLIDGGMNLIN